MLLLKYCSSKLTYFSFEVDKFIRMKLLIPSKAKEIYIK